MPYRLAVAIMLSLIAGCSARGNLTAAQAGVSTFHQMLNAGQSDVIYADSGPDMKKASKQADMAQLFAAVHRKLGNFQSGALVGWYDNALLSGDYVTVTYRAKYDRATAVETFGWRIRDGHALLASYFVNSTYLIIH
jgi:hypothetical protein